MSMLSGVKKDFRRVLALTSRDIHGRYTEVTGWVVRLAETAAQTGLHMYLAIFLGTVMAGTVSEAGYGDSYLSFLAIGWIAGGLIGLPLSTFYQWNRHLFRPGEYEMMITTGTKPHTYLVGRSLFDLVNQLLTTLIALTIALLFGLSFSPSASVAPAALAAVLGILAMGGLGLCSAAVSNYIRSWAGGEPVQTLVTLLTPVLAGLYFPPEILPQWLQTIGYALPPTWVYRIMRRSLLQGATWGQLTTDLIGLATVTALYLIIGKKILERSIETGKRKGHMLPW